MLSTSFAILNALNFFLIAIFLYLGAKQLFKSASPLNGLESIIITLLILVAVCLNFLAGIHADESYNYLEYQNTVEARAKRNFNSPNLYDYYPMDGVAGKTAASFVIIFGIIYYTKRKDKKRYAAHQERMAGGQGWQDSISSILDKNRKNTDL